MNPPPDVQPFSRGIAFVDAVSTSGWDAAVAAFSMSTAEARSWWEWYETEVCTRSVVHEAPDGMSELAGRPGTAVALGDLPLVAGEVSAVLFGARVYALAQSGLYRFIEMTRTVRNLIVARDGDVLAILQGLSALQVHGNRDNGTSEDELLRMLPTCSFLSITCGVFASLAARVLGERGFQTRLVNGLKNDEWNTYDNGHCLFEVFWPEVEKWVLADVDMGYLFRLDDTFLSAGDVWQRLQAGGDLELVPLAQKVADPFFPAPSGFNWFLRFRSQCRTEGQKLHWYRRILQNMSVGHGGKRIYVGNRDRIVRYLGAAPADVLPYAEWHERLYGQ